MPRRTVIESEDFLHEFRGKFEGLANGCIIWTGPVNGSGYGTKSWPENGVFSPVGVHRIAWEIRNGPVPPKLWVCHRCDERRCINADHLFIGSAKLDMLDAALKGRNGSQRHPNRRPRGDDHWTRRNPEAIRAVARRGEDSHYAKLNDAQVREIRRFLSEARLTNKAIGAMFGVSAGTVSRIKTRVVWSHLP